MYAALRVASHVDYRLVSHLDHAGSDVSNEHRHSGQLHHRVTESTFGGYNNLSLVQ